MQVMSFHKFFQYFFLILLLLITTEASKAQTYWWNQNWGFRIPMRVEPAASSQPSRPVAATINFSIALKAAKSKGVFIANTIRVVEVNENGTLRDDAIPTQFDYDRDFHATRKAQGTVTFLLKGNTTKSRFFHLYFETNEGAIITFNASDYRLTDIWAAAEIERLRATLDQMVVNTGEVETRPAKVSTRSRTVTSVNMARSLVPSNEINGLEPIWKNKPEHQFFPGYCTWYAARKWKEFTGSPVTWSGDGGRWYDNAAEEGRNVSDDPKAAVKGAIMVWTRRGSAGHVAIVEKVTEEGVYISEMNARGRYMVSDAFLPFTNLDKGTKYRFKGYILPQ